MPMLRSALFAFLLAAIRGAPGDDSSDSSDSSSTYCDPCGAGDGEKARSPLNACVQRSATL